MFTPRRITLQYSAFGLRLGGFLLCIFLLLNLTENACAIPVFEYRVEEPDTATKRQLWKIRKRCFSTWNRSFRSGGHLKFYGREDIAFPELSGKYSLSDWQSEVHYWTTYNYLLDINYTSEIIPVFAFPPVTKNNVVFYTGYGTVGSYRQIPPRISLVNLHIAFKSKRLAAVVYCHELGHAVFGFVHMEGGLMASPPNGIKFTKLSIVKANRLIRRWKRPRP